MQNSSGETWAEVAGLSDLKAIVITSEQGTASEQNIKWQMSLDGL